MAAGDVNTNNLKKAFCLMAGATGNVAAPTLSTDGFPNYPTRTEGPMTNGCCYPGRPAVYSTIMIKGRCTAGQVLVGTFTLWGYLAACDAWFEIPLNGGTAISPAALAETSSDQINFQQQLMNLGHYDRLAVELAAIGGAGATFDVWLVTAQVGGQ